MERTEKHGYREQTTIKGVEISCGFDSGYGDYTLYLPQIQIGKVASAKGVSDQVFRISENPDTAKKVFDKAVALANQGKDIYQIYREAEQYARTLVDEEESDEPMDTPVPTRRADERNDVAAVVNYYEKTEVNGMEISCGYDSGYRDYTLYLPQIRLGEEASARGVSDQVFRISENPKTAKKVFDKAVALARQGKDIYRVYLEAEQYARQLVNEEE